MRAMTIQCLLFSAWAGLPAVASEIRETFEEESSAAAWSFSNGPEFPGAAGKLAWMAGTGRDGGGCLGLHFDFGGGGNYVQAGWKLPEPRPGRVRLWVRKPGAHKIVFRATDHTGRTFQKGVRFARTDWQQIEIDMSRWEFGWGGSGDGRPSPPFDHFAVLIENNGDVKQGVLLIDDVEILVDPAPPEETPRCTYEPGHLRRASAGGGPGNRLEGTEWHYAFHDPATVVSLSMDGSLYGEPEALRLVVEGRSCGHTLGVTIGSHFQQFTRILGRLEGEGPQTLEVPLGDMRGWEHRDGPNDGVARLPLRLSALTLHRGEGPASGSIQLRRIEVQTRPRAGQPVLLIPDVHEEGSGLRFTLRAVNLRDRPVRGTLVCDRSGLAGRTDRQARECQLPAGGRPVEMEFVDPDRGPGLVERSWQWLEPGFVSRPVSIGTCQRPPTLEETPADPESPIGVGLYLYRFRTHPDRAAMMDRMAALAAQAGVKWTREEIQWHATEPRPGEFDWTFYDELLDVAGRHGISVYGLLAYGNSWTNVYSDEGIRRYAGWAAAAVRRYRDRIRHWEIWNEPNIFFWSGPRELYPVLLNRAYEAIKTQDPQAVVMGCSTAGIDTAFIRQVMDAGGRFDALTIHPYRGELKDLEFIRELQAARELVGGRQVWLTEMGFPSQLIDGYSERRQASLVARVYLCALASGAVRNVSWYDFRNDGDDPFYNEACFGLVRHDFRLKPGYGTLAHLARTLGSMRAAGALDLGPEVYAFRFTDGREDVVAACAPEKGGLIALRANGPLRVTDAFGQAVEPLQVGESTVLTLEPGMPAYLRGPAGMNLQAAEPPVTLTIQGRAAGETVGVCPGETVELAFSPACEAAAWELPFDWPVPRRVSPPRAAVAVYRLDVPRTAPSGEADLQVRLRLPGGSNVPLRLPVPLVVEEALIRL